MKKILKVGLTDQTLDIFIQNSSSTTGAGLTGLVFNSAGLTCYYRRGAIGSATVLTLATQTVGGAHSDGGFVEIDATNMPGMYRLDLSDAIVATGVTTVTLLLKGATNMAPLTIELQLVSVDLDDAVAFGLSRITAIEVDTQDIQARLPAALVGGRIDASIGAVVAGVIAAGSFAAGAFDAVWTVAARILTAATNITSTGGTTVPQTGDSFARIGAPVGASISIDIAAVKTDSAAIKAKTDQLVFTVANRVDSSVIDKTAFELSVAERAAIVDKLLGRLHTGGSDGGRTVAQCLALLRNKAVIASGTLTVYAADDTTPLWTAAVLTTAGNPISSIDPV